MQCIANNKYKTIDKSENSKKLDKLEIKFKEKFNEIQRYRDNRGCDEYHKLKTELKEIQSERIHIALQG